MISLGEQLASKLELQRAVDEEAGWKPDLVPPNLVNQCALEEREEVTDLIAAQLRKPLAIRPAEIITASKWRYGRRPVALLPLQERVIYRAVVNHIRNDLPPSERGSEEHDKFETELLDDDTNQHIVVTDVSNFYSSIPTDSLCEELTQRTGNWEAVQWLGNFWRSIANGRNGIPQVNEPSDIVAETYADELHRRLLRRGLRVWRYADDFRIGAATKTTAIHALEAFDDEARNLGLSINERKTYIPDRATYERHFQERDSHLSTVLEDTARDLTDFNPYTEEEKLPDNVEVFRAAALRLLEYWQHERANSKESELPVTQQVHLSLLVRQSLGVLGNLKDSDGLRFCRDILALEPQLTPVTVRYMLNAARSDKLATFATTTDCITQIALYKWQRYWLLYLLSADPLTPAEHERSIISWIKTNLNDSSEMVRSQALWTLARNWTLTQKDWKRVSTLETRLGSPYVAAALNGFHTESANTLLSSNKLDRLVHKWATRNCPIPPPF